MSDGISNFIYELREGKIENESFIAEAKLDLASLRINDLENNRSAYDVWYHLYI